MITVETSGFDELNKGIEKLIKYIDDPRATFQKASMVIYRDVIKHFQAEKDSKGNRWLRFLNPKRDQKGQPKRVNSRPTKRGGSKLLQDTGRLRESIHWAYSRRGAEVGTNLKYAPTHNYGDASRNIPEREFMWLSESAKTQTLKVFMLDLEGAI